MSITQKLIRKQYIILLGLFFLLVFSVSSAYTTNQLFDFNLTTSLNDTLGNYNFVNNGVTFPANSYADFELSESDYGYTGTSSILTNGGTNADFTVCGKINLESTPDTMYLWDERDGNGMQIRISNTGQLSAVIDGTSPTAFTTTGTMSLGSNSTFCIYYDGSENKGDIILNQVNESVGINVDMLTNDDTHTQMGRLSQNHGVGSKYYDGKIYQLCGWSRVLNLTEMNDTFVTSGCNGIGGGSPPPSDTILPIIKDVIQSPSNFTIHNLVDIVNITANITDETALNISSIYLNLTVNNTEIYINGTLQVLDSIKLYLNKTNDIFKWELDEHEIISATYPLNPEIMEITPHLNNTISGLSSWLKMKFYNVSNDKRQVFTEIMDENATSISCLSDYFYCNVNYTTGNPVSSEWCTLFFQASNNRAYNHSHSINSKHKVLPMGIDTSTGELNGVAVSPISYILKRGTTCTDRYFYVSNISQDDQSQTSGNNGNTWSNLIGTVDSHIHQIGENDSFSYQICASDDSSNKNCSILYQDYIDFPIFRPNNVDIISPTSLIYNDSILINHTQSFSASGQTIISYTYYYSIANNNNWFVIDSVNHPTTSYSWDISTFLNGDYQIKVTVLDSLNLTSETVSETFEISNPLSVTNQLLTINNSLSNNILGAIELTGYFIIIGILLFVGIITRLWITWSLSGGIWYLIYIKMGEKFVGSGLGSDKAIMYVSLALAIGFFIMGIVLQIMQSINNKKSSSTDFYNLDYS